MRSLPIFVYGVFDNQQAVMFTYALLYYQNMFGKDKEDEEDKYVVKIYINSPGGSVTDLMGMIDAMDNITIPVEIYCLGQAASCGAVLLASGPKGKRFIGKNSRVLIHQVSMGAAGKVDDVEAYTAEGRRLNDDIIKILAKKTKKTKAQIKEDMKKELFLSAKEAVEYGIADKVLGDNTDEIKGINDSFEKKLFDGMAADYEVKNFIEDRQRGTVEMPFEIKSIEEDETNYIVKGYVGIYEEEDRYGDIIDVGAFDDTLKTCTLLDAPNDRSMLWQHDPKEPIGRASLQTDKDGLNFVSYLPKEDSFVSGRVIPQFRVGSIQKMSFGYRALKYYYKDGRRHLSKIDLAEVSPVTFAAMNKAKILEVKSDDVEFANVKDVSDFLKTVGLSKSKRDDIINVMKRHCKDDADNLCKEGSVKGLIENLNSINKLIKGD